MAPLLPRFYRFQQAADERKLARVLLESGDESAPPRSAPGATAAGDPSRLRGIPAIGRGVSGTARGTSPLGELLRRENDRRRQIADRVGRSVTVVCDQCGDRFELSVRNEFRHRTEGTRPRCRMCRRPQKPMTDEERARYVDWWLTRSGLSLDELRELAVELG